VFRSGKIWSTGLGATQLQKFPVFVYMYYKPGLQTKKLERKIDFEESEVAYYSLVNTCYKIELLLQPFI
jgi:hypothetical protein